MVLIFLLACVCVCSCICSVAYTWKSEEIYGSQFSPPWILGIKLWSSGFPFTQWPILPVPCLVKFVITVSKIKYHRTWFHNPFNKYLLRSFPYIFVYLLATEVFIHTYILFSFHSKLLYLLHSVYQVFSSTPYKNTYLWDTLNCYILPDTLHIKYQ